MRALASRDAASFLTGRWRSLDVLRGLAVVAMILVENQGSGAHAFWGLSHSPWNGWTPADLVFPLFLFAAGAVLGIRPPNRVPVPKLLRRAALLFAIGVGLNLLPPASWDHFIVMGVLQRIALAWLLAALVVRWLPLRRQVALGAGILVLYWLLLALNPIHPDLNTAGVVDRAVFGASHMYSPGYDPQGLLGTLPSVVSVLAGCWTVLWLRRHVPVDGGVVVRLTAAGLGCVALGQLWGLLFPVNKRLWTSSFVVVAAGAAMVVTALVCYLVDVRGWRGGKVCEVFGANALVVFAGSEALTDFLRHSGARVWLYDTIFGPVFSFRLGSLAYGVAIVAFWYLVALVLWRRRIFIRV